MRRGTRHDERRARLRVLDHLAAQPVDLLDELGGDDVARKALGDDAPVANRAEPAEVLRGDLTAEQLRGMLVMKRAEVERRVAAEHAQLARIAGRSRRQVRRWLQEYGLLTREPQDIHGSVS